MKVDWGLIIGYTLLVLTVGGALSLCSAPPTPQAEPTVTPWVTNTPMPKPTATSTPAPTATSYVGRMEYLTEVVRNLEALDKASAELRRLGAESDTYSPAWEAIVRAQITTIKRAHLQLDELYVPLEMRDYHDALIDGTADCSRAMDYLAKELDQPGGNNAEVSIGLWENCARKLDYADSILEKIE